MKSGFVPATVILSDSEAKIKRHTREAYRAATDQEEHMKQAQYQSYDELPIFLNAKMVADVLGVSPSSGYELMREKNFPALNEVSNPALEAAFGRKNRI